MRNIRLVEVRSELAAGTRGASMGIDALIVASLDKKSDFFSIFDPINVPDANRYLWKSNKFTYAKHIDGVYQVLNNVYSTIKSLRKNKIFPIVLAGDHSTAAGTIIGIKMADPHKRLGIVWIDAHADLHTPYTTPSGNMHGMPLAICLGIDNLLCKKNELDADTLGYWEKVKNLGTAGPKILAEDIVYVAVRSTEDAEDYLMDKHGIKNFGIPEIREVGIAGIAEKVLLLLVSCDQIYISFDVDSMDSSISKGTGTPVAEGLTVEEAILLNAELIKDKRVCCWEIVEVNPTLDTKNLMAENAFEVLEATTNSLFAHF